MSSQDGAEAQGTQVRQTPCRLDPSLTLSLHMPRVPGVSICPGGLGNGASHAFPTFPSIPQSCAPLTFAAPGTRRLDFMFLCRRPMAEGGGEFGREWGLMLMQIFNVNRFVSAKPPPAIPPRPALGPGHTGAPLILRRPAEAEGPCCARAGHHMSGRGSSLSL